MAQYSPPFNNPPSGVAIPHPQVMPPTNIKLKDGDDGESRSLTDITLVIKVKDSEEDEYWFDSFYLNGIVAMSKDIDLTSHHIQIGGNVHARLINMINRGIDYLICTTNIRKSDVLKSSIGLIYFRDGKIFSEEMIDKMSHQNHNIGCLNFESRFEELDVVAMRCGKIVLDNQKHLKDDKNLERFVLKLEKERFEIDG